MNNATSRRVTLAGRLTNADLKMQTACLNPPMIAGVGISLAEMRHRRESRNENDSALCLRRSRSGEVILPRPR